MNNLIDCIINNRYLKKNEKTITYIQRQVSNCPSYWTDLKILNLQSHQLNKLIINCH